ncbi:OTU domain-containing protein 6B [Geranomyces variabilis]|uniref:OTU domain-containing protein 6B n=1 Tax=Geranomyces variabilis TaxID=109894 RepID=A0AAD5TMC9_9FUNG|nr:OTU domain-containing protein 6B [Geranomyces variabilis]
MADTPAPGPQAPVVVATEILEDQQARHRKEIKDLTGKITALKKTVGGNKQKKKDVQAQAALMERELAERHARETAELLAQLEPAAASATAAIEATQKNASAAAANTIAEEAGVVGLLAEDGSSSQQQALLDVDDAGGERKKRPNKAQLRKQRKIEEFEAMRRAAAEEAANSVNTKEVEDEAIAELLAPLNLRVKQIPPDGHCMYSAIADQLGVRAGDHTKTYKEMRTLAAGFLRSHPDDFIPFLVNSNGDMFTEEEFALYCNEVEGSAAWGGQTELQALARALRRPIHIVQAGTPTLVVGEQFTTSEPLFVSYHKHAYGLGAHYNSLLPV